MFNDPRLELLIPAHKIEQGAIEQIAQVLDVKPMLKMAIMPDVHQGYDIPIGGVVLLDGYIWPGAVGVDINCGMCHISLGQTINSLGLSSVRHQKEFFKDLIAAIPTNHNGRKKNLYSFTDFPNKDDKEFYKRVMARMRAQLGTLGGGNHFLNVGTNINKEMALTLHTGSRNPGNVIGNYWMAKAKKEGENFNGLCMFRIDSDLGQAYLRDMLWAFDYADLNREIIMAEALKLLGLKIDKYRKIMINETHNHAVVNNDGTVLHRKGATPAEKGVLGIIPGNMRDGVFVTEGLGNEQYLSSSSHGAGRRLSRKKAKRQIRVDDVKREMEELGILVNLTEHNCDESPDAYKNIFEVIAAQEDKVIKVRDHFRPKIVHIG